MRRAVTLITLIALSASLAIPAIALAKGPPTGKGPGLTPPGLEKKAERTEQQDPSPSEQDADPKGSGEKGAPAKRSEKAGAKEERRAEKAERKTERKAERETGKAAGKATRTTERTQYRGEEATSTPGVGGPPVDGKRTGIENALSRILANIERAEARVESGRGSKVPPGLLKVAAKFLGWLGIDAGDDADTSDPDGGGSHEETGTVGPPDGSDEETMTVGVDSD